jgi:hypothetical protein
MTARNNGGTVTIRDTTSTAVTLELTRFRLNECMQQKKVFYFFIFMFSILLFFTIWNSGTVNMTYANKKQ